MEKSTLEGARLMLMGLLFQTMGLKRGYVKRTPEGFSVENLGVWIGIPPRMDERTREKVSCAVRNTEQVLNTKISWTVSLNDYTPVAEFNFNKADLM